jgi:drug/metabolite transporter superfamily protein YnfA
MTRLVRKGVAVLEGTLFLAVPIAILIGLAATATEMSFGTALAWFGGAYFVVAVPVSWLLVSVLELLNEASQEEEKESWY